MNGRYTIAFAMVGSFALGAVAVQTLHAQAKPPAFSIAEITVTDQDGYLKEFAPSAVKAIQEAGGKALARGKGFSLEGAPAAGRVVVLQFESMDKLLAFENSPTNLRKTTGTKYATFRVIGVEGVAP